MKRYFPLVLVLGCAAVFALGLVQLFKLRFEVGDVYPPYSSLRSDPLGAMALYESLEKIPGLSVSRDFTTANRLPDGKDTTYLHLAASPSEWRWLPEETFKEIEQFLARGGRLVITLFPEASTYSRPRDWGEAETNAEPSRVKNSKDDNGRNENKPVPARPKKKPRHPDEEDYGISYTSLEEQWGVDFEIVNLSHGEGDAYEPVPVYDESDLPLPKTLDWHSGVIFTNLARSWQTIYSRGTNAVVIERKFGHGTVVIATDSYFLSNEAMQKDRHAELLAWLVGPGRNVFFDEAHLGVTESSGVAALMRKYRLHWLAAGLILLAGLFIWKNSVSLVLVREDEELRNYVAGKDAAAGFVNLLRRSIPARELLPTCFAEWKKSVAQAGKYSAARLQQAETVFRSEESLPAKDSDPVRTYRTISRILQTRNPEPATLKPEQKP
jgi:hypothetical protein